MLEILIDDPCARERTAEIVSCLASRDESLAEMIDSPSARLLASAGLRLDHLHATADASPGDLYSAGITSWTLAVFARTGDEAVERARRVLASALARSPGFAGLYLEGPFIEASRSQADSDAVTSLFDRISGRIAAIVFAPECVRMDSFVAALRDHGVAGIVGHTQAGYDMCREAFALGAEGLCLPFLATRPFHHRDPGPIGAAVRARAFVEMPLGPGALTAEQALFLARAFGQRVRPVYHPAGHDEMTGQMPPADFARRAAAAVGAGADGFLRSAASADGSSLALFGEDLTLLAVAVAGKVEFMARRRK